MEVFKNTFTEYDIEEWLFYEESLSANVVRADGELACEACGFTYYQHPFTGDRSYDGLPFLRILCDGSIIKT